MGERFLKSALPALDSLLDDSSLALPAEPSPRSSTRIEPSDRSLRVQQQVRLTLERKSKRSLFNGGVSLQRNTARSLDAADGFSLNPKVNGSSFISRTLSMNHVKRPSRKVEMSPKHNPDLFRSRNSYSTYHHWMNTVPGPSQSHAPGTLRSSGNSDSFQHYAFSEAARGKRLSTPRTFSHTPFRQTVPSQSASARFQQHAKNGFLSSHRQNTVKQEKHTDQMFGSPRPDEGLIWPAQVKTDGQKLRRLKSFPPTVDRAERQISMQQKLNLTTQESKNKPSEMTLKKAVSLLTSSDEETLIKAACFIQNQCFQRDEAKMTVLEQQGIEQLLQLLNNDSEEVQRAAAGALRNVVHNNEENKLEVKDHDGMVIILNALASSIDKETRRQLTGLMWNLSSHDILKVCFPENTAYILTKSILVPSSGIFEGEHPKDELLADANAFYNATGCLKNLSSAGPDVRQAMRACENLIDSLIYYIRGTVANQNTDDKSTENCVCILRNLNFQFCPEIPQQHTLLPRESRQNSPPEQTGVGCFSHRSAKITKEIYSVSQLRLIEGETLKKLPVSSFDSFPVQDVEQQRPLLVPNPNPRGAEWLWSPIAMRMYVSLAVCSTRLLTKEAAVGALQNITAEKQGTSKAFTVPFCQQENIFQHIKNILKGASCDLQKTTVSLTANLSNHQELHPLIASQLLQELLDVLLQTDLPNETTTNLLHVLVQLSKTDVETVKAILKQGALKKILNISSKDNGQASKKACILLQIMWDYPEMRSTLKKSGFRKSHLVNTKTKKVLEST